MVFARSTRWRTREVGCPSRRGRRDGVARPLRAARPACVTTRPAGPASPYTAAVGLLVPRSAAFDSGSTLAVFENGAAGVPLELPRDLPQIAEWPRVRLDGDHYQHRVALARSDGGFELLEHVCADAARLPGRGTALCSRGHGRAGQHSWGDSGHEADDLAYSLLCARYGGRFAIGPEGCDPPLPALILPGLFEVIARLSRGHGWSMRWDQLLAIATETSGMPAGS